MTDANPTHHAVSQSEQVRMIFRRLGLGIGVVMLLMVVSINVLLRLDLSDTAFTALLVGTIVVVLGAGTLVFIRVLMPLESIDGHRLSHPSEGDGRDSGRRQTMLLLLLMIVVFAVVGVGVVSNIVSMR